MNEQSESERRGSQSPGLEVQSWWGRLLVGRRPARTLIRALVLVLVVTGLVKWCFLPIRITGRSMEPTYHDGRLNVLNLLAFHRREPRRGDVVGIRLNGRRMVLMKRVMGLPGERVLLRDGIVHVNGSTLDEPYARGDELPSMREEAELGPDEYFVVGDNRDVSEFGVVARSEIIGKVLF